MQCKLKTEKMDNKRIKLDSNMNINDLLDECLEEIFSKLRGKEQLKARFVCKQWNDLLIERQRLLQKNVGIYLNFANHIARDRALLSLSINPALKVYKVLVDASIFRKFSFIKEIEINPEDYFRPFNFDSVEQLTFYWTDQPVNFNILNVLLGKMLQLKTLSLKTSWMANSKSEKIANNAAEHKNPSVQKLIIDHTYEHPIRFWSNTNFENIGYLCERFPKLQTIVGVPGFDERFYEKFCHLIECPVLKINEETQEIFNKTEMKPKQIHFYQDLSQNYDSRNLWRYLSQNIPELDSINLVYDDGGIDWDSGDTIIIPQVDHSKVKILRIHYGITEFMRDENLQQVLKLFSSLVTLEFRSFIGVTHFFGHEPFQMTNLEKSTIYLYNCVWDCVECLDSLMKSMVNVKSLRMSALDPNIVQSIGRHLPQIKELYFEWPMQEQEVDFFLTWPSTTHLEKLVIPGQKVTKPESITHFCEMCPNMKRLELYLNDVFDTGIMSILLEKLKYLEAIKFKEGEYMVTVVNGKHCFANQ